MDFSFVSVLIYIKQQLIRVYISISFRLWCRVRTFQHQCFNVRMTLAKPYFIDVCWHFWPVDASEKVMAHAPCMLPTNQG
jgi:hypothetical protein